MGAEKAQGDSRSMTMTTTTATKTRTVDIADLVRHRDYQVRRKLDNGTVHRYATTMRGGKAKLTPWDRGDLVQQAEGVTETIKGGGEWTRPDF